MQYRSIVSLFIIVCLLIISLFGDVAESRNPLEHGHRSNNHNPATHSTVLKRMKRRSRSTSSRRRRRDDDDSFGNDAIRDNNGAGADGFPLGNDQFQGNNFGQ